MKSSSIPCPLKISGRNLAAFMYVFCSVTRLKLPNVYESCPKMISLEKLMILTSLQKLLKNVGDLSKFIVAKCFEWLRKV